MSENPYDPPVIEAEAVSQGRIAWGKLFLNLLVSYLFGIVACILLTDVELYLVYNLFFVYVSLAPVGIVLWGILAINESWPPYEWQWVVLMILLPIVLEIVAYVRPKLGLARFRPCWLAFPIGFLGPIGIYWAATLSI